MTLKEISIRNLMRRKGKAAFVTASGDVALTDQGDGTTLMKYGGEFQVGGRLVSVGQRLIDSVSKKMLKNGLDTLNSALRERMLEVNG